MNTDPFRPFDTNLDQDTALSLLREAVAGAAHILYYSGHAGLHLG